MTTTIRSILLRVCPFLFLGLGYFYFGEGTPGYYACITQWGIWLVGAILFDEIRGLKK